MRKYKKIIIWGVAIFLIIGGFSSYKIYKSKNKKIEYSTYTAVPGKLVQLVSATGSVEPSAEFKLNFKTSGKLGRVEVKTGDEVKGGDVLARLESSDLAIEVKQAEAALNLAKANLYQKLAGESPESIDFYAKKVEEAEAALKAAEINLRDASDNLSNVKITTQEEIENAELSLAAAKDSLDDADNTLKNTKAESSQAVSQAYESAETTMKGNLIYISTAMMDMDNTLGIDNTTANDSFENFLGIINAQTKIDAPNAYISAREAQKRAENAVNKLTGSSAYAEIDSAAKIEKETLKTVDDALIKVKSLLDSSVADASAGFSQTVLAAKKTTINTDRSSINSAISSLETKQQAIASANLSATSGNDSAQAAYQTAKNNYDQSLHALSQTKTLAKSKTDTAQAGVNSAQNQVEMQKAALASAQATLTLKKSDPREVDLASLKAQVEQAEASLELSRSRYGESVLKAPVDGIITDVNFEQGEQVSPTQSVVSMLSNDKFQIEIDVPESDIAKVKIGNLATVTLDAFGEETVFAGKALFIEPAATIISGVTYYKIKVQFDEPSAAIKPGMTANVVITTEEKENVLSVPVGAIEYGEGKKFVKILDNGAETKIEITTGLRGSEGMIEVTSGLEGGEKVITFSKEE